MKGRLITSSVGIVAVTAAIVVTLVALHNGSSRPSPAEVVQRFSTVRTCSQLRSETTATYWQVWNTQQGQACADQDVAEGFRGLTAKIRSTQLAGDTAYVTAIRLCHGSGLSPHCNGQEYYFTLLWEKGAWKVDDVLWQQQ